VRCTLCGNILPGWLVILDEPHTSLLLYHLGASHRGQYRSHLKRMETECLATVVMELFERVETPSS
jgi:hypothetical protein